MLYVSQVSLHLPRQDIPMCGLAPPNILLRYTCVTGKHVLPSYRLTKGAIARLGSLKTVTGV